MLYLVHPVREGHAILLTIKVLADIPIGLPWCKNKRSLVDDSVAKQPLYPVMVQRFPFCDVFVQKIFRIDLCW